MPTDSPETLIGLAYDAILDPEPGWDRFARAASRVLGGNDTRLTLRLPDGQVTCLAAPEPEFLDSYRQYHGRHDPWDAPAARLPAGAVTWVLSEVDHRELRRSEFFADWLAPQGLTGSGLTSMALKDGAITVAMFGAYGNRAARSLEAQDEALLTLLTPHLRRALSATRELLAARMRLAIESSVLSVFRFAALVVSHDGRVVECNRKAEELLRGGHGPLRTERGRIAGATSDQTNRLRSAVHQATAGIAGLRGGTSLRLASSRLEAGLCVLVVPLPIPSPGFDVRVSVPAALVLLTDPAATPSLARAMRESYGLTRAEARLADVLVRGSTLLEAAEALRVQPSTARSQLRAVLAKLGVRRQAEIVRTALMLPAAMLELAGTEKD